MEQFGGTESLARLGCGYIVGQDSLSQCLFRLLNIATYLTIAPSQILRSKAIMVATAHTTEDTSSAYPGIPPFPNDVPTAPLLRLNYSALQTSDAERNAFFTASKELGFFYLDLRGDELGEQLLAESELLFHVGEDLFKEGADELNKYDYSKGEKEEGSAVGDGAGSEVRWKEGREPSYMGYKSIGKGVVDKAGNRDKNEFYNVRPPFFILSVFVRRG